MIYKANNTEKESPDVEVKTDAVEVVTHETVPDSLKPSGVNMFIRSNEKKPSVYVIEPSKRTQRGRRFAVIAVAVLLFMLSGFIFQYGNLVVDSYTSTYSGGTVGKSRRVKGSNSSVVTISSDNLISISLVASSVEKDMNVRIVGEDSYPILGQVFQIKITSPEGEVTVFTDKDKTGRFYIQNLESGEYTVVMLPVEGYITPEAISVEVLDKVQFVEIVNIAEKIVHQKDVNSATEDPQYNNAGNVDAGTPSVSEPMKDTVEFVESKIVENKSSKFSAHVNEEGRLFTREGTITDIIPVIVNGYLTENGDYSMYETPEPDPEPDPDPELPEDSEGGDIDLFEKNESGEYIYDITEHVEVKTTYYGWQDIDGKRYYFDKNGKKVTGNQTIQGRNYSFSSDGVLTDSSSKRLGIDVSTWQNYIDWKKVKASGVDFVMIRAGFRGYGSGPLVEDDLFYTNLKGAKEAGLRVGVYFFSQAINEVEGVEEASMVVSLLRKYGISLDYPIAFDSEYSGAAGNTGRADKLSRNERTAIAVAFCETVRSAGYSPMVYASKSWFETNLSTGSFGNYYIWLAHYTSGGATSSYTGRYEMWQYTSQGTVNGIAGNVDMNYGYLGY
ncbi:MAG: hypothetical protein FWG21_01530 [Oscillospiraceae bacterium]|nr:hypothetical protein [Oscillospiraceae bacterium]